MIIVYSRKEMREAYLQGITNKHLIISIIGYDELTLPVIEGMNTIYTLTLKFDDVDEYVERDGRAHYPISTKDVHSIIDFINKYKKEIFTEEYDLYVHCAAGISRSAAVAAAISKIVFGNDENFFNNGRFKPNMNVYSSILRYFYSMMDYV